MLIVAQSLDRLGASELFEINKPSERLTEFSVFIHVSAMPYYGPFIRPRTSESPSFCGEHLVDCRDYVNRTVHKILAFSTLPRLRSRGE